MVKWVQVIHAVLLIVAAVGFFCFWARTRFWFQRYAHYLAAFAFALGLSLLSIMPSDAPINRDVWGGAKKAGLVLIFSGLVYFFFVFYGGQRAAYQGKRPHALTPCPYCRSPRSVSNSRCSNCGQTIS